MEALIQRLQKDVARTKDAKLVATESWTIPMQRLHVTYAPVQRLSMDILMKMLLMTFHELHITSLHAVSDLLAVEHLFVEDLTNTLLRNELVTIIESVYTLTTRGEEQLASGVLEDALQTQEIDLTYSPLHNAYFTEDVDALYDAVLPEPYAYVDEACIQQATAPQDALIALLQQLQPNDTDVKAYVSSLKDCSMTEMLEVPCIAFVLYDARDDVFSTRVWNTLTNRYDDVLEAHFLEHAMATWRQT